MGLLLPRLYDIQVMYLEDVTENMNFLVKDIQVMYLEEVTNNINFFR